MSQHDMVIDNGPGLTVRTDINAAIQALASLNAGPVEPTVKYPGQMWLDTTVAPDGLLRQRNQANSDWVALQTGVPADVLSNIVVTVITSSGTYTKPAGLKFLEVTVVGGGGGTNTVNATAASQSSASGGGGGGGTVIKLYRASDLSATEAYTIGANGTANPGTNGGTSTFKALSAGGGLAGGAQAGNSGVNGFSAGGFGGSASGGDINVSGGEGGPGIRAAHGTTFTACTGAAGGTALAAPAWGEYWTAGTGIAGAAGRAPGGGGSGAANGQSQASQQFGQVGAAGRIYLKEFF